MNVLCTPFLYFFAFRSNSVYLSFGSISSSVGISSFHRSTAAATMPCFASALSTQATMRSTRRNRWRWRYFCMLDMRQGIFLRQSARALTHWHWRAGGAYQRRPPLSGCEGRRNPNIIGVEWRRRVRRVFNWGAVSSRWADVGGVQTSATGGGLVIYQFHNHRERKKKTPHRRPTYIPDSLSMPAARS